MRNIATYKVPTAKILSYQIERSNNNSRRKNIVLNGQSRAMPLSHITYVVYKL